LARKINQQYEWAGSRLICNLHKAFQSQGSASQLKDFPQSWERADNPGFFCPTTPAERLAPQMREFLDDVCYPNPALAALQEKRLLRAEEKNTGADFAHF